MRISRSMGSARLDASLRNMDAQLASETVCLKKNYYGESPKHGDHVSRNMRLLEEVGHVESNE